MRCSKFTPSTPFAQFSNSQFNIIMKKLMFLWAAMLSVAFFCACSEKEEYTNDDPQAIEHNQLFEKSYDGSYTVYGQQGTENEWHNSYFLHFDFITDTTVVFSGSIWHSGDIIIKDIYKVEEWNDTMAYSFSDNEGIIYGKRPSIWNGEETSILLGVNDSLQLATRNKGLVSLALQ